MQPETQFARDLEMKHYLHRSHMQKNVCSQCAYLLVHRSERWLMRSLLRGRHTLFWPTPHLSKTGKSTGAMQKKKTVKVKMA